MDINSLKGLLTECSVSDLQKHLEDSILDSLEALNIRFTPNGLSTALSIVNDNLKELRKYESKKDKYES